MDALIQAEKKLAVTVFSFPPDKGNVGTAAYLNVFSSIFSVLKELQRDGYNDEGLPETSEVLIEDVIYDKEAQFSSPNLNVAYKMSVREYKSLTPYATTLEENWGKPPGNLNSDGKNLLVYGKQHGNVFIGVQPTFGYEDDPMRLLFSKSASPHHGFAAYYSFVEKIFKADAVLHFGTHRSLELMPVEEEEISAKERDLVVGKVYYKIMEIESRLLSCGLHVIGEPPSAMEAVATLVNVAALDRPEDGISSLPSILAASIGRDIEEVTREY